MSAQLPEATPLQERDDVSRRVLHMSAFGFVFLIAAGLLVTWIVERGESIHVGYRSERAHVTVVPHEVQMIDQTLFEAHLPSRGNWETKERQLRSYAWADDTHQTVQIPIDRAMQMLVAQGHVE